jgi:hypothetical protein
VFDRIWITHVTIGGTVVEWALKANFNDPGPFVYQLQLGRTGSNTADDWINVGLPVEDACYAVDDSQRVHGRTQWTHYRVKLTTDAGVFYSNPEPVFGKLDNYDWRRVKEIIRSYKLYLQKTHAGTKGSLLKRRLFGTPCSCTDELTQGIRLPNHEECYGTGIVGGYFDPIPCSYAEFSTEAFYNTVDDARGTVQDGPDARVKLLNVPQVFSGDVWVNATTDERWYIHDISTIAEVRGVPIILGCTFSLAPFKDVIYQFPVD